MNVQKQARQLGWLRWPPAHWCAQVTVAPLFGPNAIIVPADFMVSGHSMQKVRVVLEMFYAGLTPKQIDDSVRGLRHPLDVMTIVHAYTRRISRDLMITVQIAQSARSATAYYHAKYNKLKAAATSREIMPADWHEFDGPATDAAFAKVAKEFK